MTGAKGGETRVLAPYGLLMGSLRESGMQARARVCGKHQHLEQGREGNSPHSRGSSGISSAWHNRRHINTDQTHQEATAGRRSLSSSCRQRTLVPRAELGVTVL